MIRLKTKLTAMIAALLLICRLIVALEIETKQLNMARSSSVYPEGSADVTTENERQECQDKLAAVKRWVLLN